MEEKPRLHTLHLKGLLELQTDRHSRKAQISRPRLRPNSGVLMENKSEGRRPVGLQVDLQVVGARERSLTLLTAVLFVSCDTHNQPTRKRYHGINIFSPWQAQRH